MKNHEPTTTSCAHGLEIPPEELFKLTAVPRNALIACEQQYITPCVRHTARPEEVKEAIRRHTLGYWMGFPVDRWAGDPLRPIKSGIVYTKFGIAAGGSLLVFTLLNNHSTFVTFHERPAGLSDATPTEHMFTCSPSGLARVPALVLVKK